MIVPSIDISEGRVVQLVGGEQLAIDAGEATPWIEQFSRVGEVAVIDIDAARGTGSNASMIRPLLATGDVRIGGGIRTIETALAWLDAGAAKVIIGTAATPEFLSALPKERVIVAADAMHGQIVSHGWRATSGVPLLEHIERLKDFCGGFLVTFVEREGRKVGTDMALAADAVNAAFPARVTVAGGVTTADEIAALNQLGADAQVGMALYDGTLGLGTAVAATLRSDRHDGLIPTVVVDETGIALGLAWSNEDSITEALRSGTGVYHSRTRGLWQKGATSGASQELRGIAIDCDSDALRFTVRQSGTGFCHHGTRTCWGEDGGLVRLSRRVAQIAEEPPSGSNTAKLFGDPSLLAAKLREEVDEVIGASTPSEAAEEIADLLYFVAVKAAAFGLSIADIDRILDRRERRVTRRPMERKDR